MLWLRNEPMPNIQNKVQVLLKWCAENSIVMDENIRIGNDNKTRIIVCSEDDFIHPKTTLVKIPKTAVISARSCSLARAIYEAPYGLAAQLSLSLALYVEILKGTESRWYGYIQSLPEGIVDLPSFWDFHHEANTTSTSRQDVAKGSIFLRGTEAGKICNGRLENGVTKLEEVTRFYCEVAGPLLLRNANMWHNESDSPSLLGFYRAFSLVSSRAFLVDAYHGLAMVPIADAFNHVLENHVHLESDYNVCCECGSLQECTHDRDEGASDPVFRKPSDEHDFYYEMVSNTAIPPHTEIFNTYGEDLTNAQLLNQYGFILDVNENDRLFWTLGDVLETLASEYTAGGVDSCHQQRLTHDLRDLLAYLLEVDLAFGQLQLVYYEASKQNVFCLNSDGIMSHHLWLMLFILSISRHFPNRKRPDPSHITQTAHSVLELQTELELENMEDEEDIGRDNDDHTGRRKPIRKTHDQDILAILYDIARLAMQLCGTRKANSGPEGLSAEQLSDILDVEIADAEGDGSTTRAELAISVLLGEGSILDSCEAAWAALLDSARTMTLDSASDDGNQC